MKIAFIIIAHKNPEELSRLISQLTDNDFSFYIHINLKSSLKFFEDVFKLSIIIELYLY